MIYRAAITTYYSEDGWAGGKAPKEMRFAGKEFCINYVKKLLDKDGYLRKETIDVILLAFTGMELGEYTATREEYGYSVKTKNKELQFNFNGIQLNAKNPKFANKIAYVLY